MAASAASLVQNTSCCHVRSSRAPGKPEPEAGTRPGQAGDACGGSASLRDCFDRSDKLASLRHRPGVGQRLLKPRWQMADGERPPLLPRLSSSVICHLSFVICHLSSAICHLPSVICHLSFAICAFAAPPSPGSTRRQRSPGTGSGIALAAALRSIKSPRPPAAFREPASRDKLRNRRDPMPSAWAGRSTSRPRRQTDGRRSLVGCSIAGAGWPRRA